MYWNKILFTCERRFIWQRNFERKVYLHELDFVKFADSREFRYRGIVAKKIHSYLGETRYLGEVIIYHLLPFLMPGFSTILFIKVKDPVLGQIRITHTKIRKFVSSVRAGVV